MSITERIAEIRERESKATPGEWEIGLYTNYEGFSIYAENVGCIAERWWPSKTDVPIKENAEFIAHSREDIPWLCDQLTAAQERVKELEAQIARSEGWLVQYLKRQEAWSAKIFGHGLRTGGITQHIEKELNEIRQKPHDLSEWIDVIILGMDGFWRHGGDPSTLPLELMKKQDTNFNREWPRPISEDVAVEHIREK